jgi:hypothetical protein
MESMDSALKMTDEAFCTHVLEGLNKDYELFALVNLCPGNKKNNLRSIEDLRKRIINCESLRPEKRLRY